MASLITLCNQALAEIYKPAIAGLDERSIEARECNRFAEPLLSEMVEWSDCFPFARKREGLAAVANDRPAEWLYAYAVPSDMSTPLAVRKVEEAAQYLPISGPFNFPLQSEEVLAFVHEQGHIYTNVEQATLIYTRKDMAVSELPALGERAFVTELAARLAAPLTKDRKLARDMRELAEVSRVRFVADEENKNPRPQKKYVSDAEWARLGYEV